jgi:hypothetical protein
VDIDIFIHKKKLIKRVNERKRCITFLLTAWIVILWRVNVKFKTVVLGRPHITFIYAIKRVISYTDVLNVELGLREVQGHSIVIHASHLKNIIRTVMGMGKLGWCLR